MPSNDLQTPTTATARRNIARGETQVKDSYLAVIVVVIVVVVCITTPGYQCLKEQTSRVPATLREGAAITGMHAGRQAGRVCVCVSLFCVTQQSVRCAPARSALSRAPTCPAGHTASQTRSKQQGGCMHYYMQATAVPFLILL